MTRRPVKSRRPSLKSLKRSVALYISWIHRLKLSSGFPARIPSSTLALRRTRSLDTARPGLTWVSVDLLVVLIVLFVPAENSSSTVQLEWSVKGVAHREGGWPREIDCQEVDQVNRYLKKIEKDDGFLNTALGLANLMEEKVKQNNAVEIYTSYFTDSDELTSWAESEARTVMVYSDPVRRRGERGRPVSAVSWSTDGGSKLAVAYCSPEFLGSSGASGEGFTFSVEDPTKHCDVLASSSPLTSIAHSGKEPASLAGGCYSGAVSCWDIRADSRPVSTTSFDKSHTQPVYKVGRGGGGWRDTQHKYSPPPPGHLDCQQDWN